MIWGGPSLVPMGGTLNPSNYSFGINQGLNLTGGFASPGNYSIEMKFNFANLDGWQKIIDFKNQSADEGLYDYWNKLQFVVQSGFGFETAVNDGFVSNQDVRLILTRDASSKQVVGYLAGIEQISFIDTTNQALFSGTNKVAYFLVDEGLGGEASIGSIDYLRIYDAPVTASQAACLDTGSPVTCGLAGIPEPNTITLVLFGLTLIGLSKRQTSAHLKIKRFMGAHG